jgi:hypothetical protein
MFYLCGRDACYSTVFDLSHVYLQDKPASEASFLDWKTAYNRYLNSFQPLIPQRRAWGVQLVDDKALEDNLLWGFYRESPLDDLDRYRDTTFFENGPEHRAEISQDVAYLREIYPEYARHDAEYWKFFELVINYILCPKSRYSRGGADSDAIGVLYMVEPRKRAHHDMYEILIHETTHNIMFLDERIHGHYASYRILPAKENFARAAITGLLRPLDKVLHSLVVVTEVLLHRQRVLGHDADTTIHPRSEMIVKGGLATIESIHALPNKNELLTPRAFDLIEQCRNHLVRA